MILWPQGFFCTELSFTRDSHEKLDLVLFIDASFLKTEVGGYQAGQAHSSSLLEYSPLPEGRSAQMEEFIAFTRDCQPAKDYRIIINTVL